jgi:D-alanyl-D-alanine carboxypeptidase/D-alanyl-D-alanine-endopeptidase (penicillin-binding protein 4)
MPVSASKHALFLAAWLVAGDGAATLPQPIARAFLDQGIPLRAVGAYVQEIGEARPLIEHQAARPMNPASTMKLLTTFAALELLGPGYRWRTEAYADGPISDGVLAGNLVLKGYGDPKITVEQFQQLILRLRATGLTAIRGDLVLDRSYFATGGHDPAAFDGEPLKPYNVGPDALLVNFKSVRFVFAPEANGDAVDVRAEPALSNVVIRSAPSPGTGDCGEWRGGLRALFADRADRADAAFRGRYPIACGERDWYVALLDHPHYVLGMFAAAWAAAGGTFSGNVREGRVPSGVSPLATLDSVPLSEVVRDINKLSNNVMARQVFLTLAVVEYPPPATTSHAAAVLRHWLRERKASLPDLALENGSGLSRHERIAAQSLGRLLLAADQSKVRAEYLSSLAVAAADGTVRKRFENEDVADQAMLKTGSLEGVRAIAGYVLAPNGRSFVVVCFVNHANAAAAQPALDQLVKWVYASAGSSAR